MVKDGAFAMPTTSEFYRDLFANATRDPPIGLGASRMVLFEQVRSLAVLLSRCLAVWLVYAPGLPSHLLSHD